MTHSTSTRSLTSVGSGTLESAELAFPLSEFCGFNGEGVGFGQYWEAVGGEASKSARDAPPRVSRVPRVARAPYRPSRLPSRPPSARPVSRAAATSTRQDHLQLQLQLQLQQGITSSFAKQLSTNATTRSKSSPPKPLSQKHQRPNSGARIINGPNDLKVRAASRASKAASSIANNSNHHRSVAGNLKPATHTNKPASHATVPQPTTHKHRQTQHPPSFVVRHVNENEVFPDELEKPLIGAPVPITSSKKFMKKRPKSSLKNATASGVSDLDQRQPIANDQENTGPINLNLPPQILSKLNKFTHEKSNILRAIQHLKTQYARTIGSPFRRTPIPHSPTRFTSVTVEPPSVKPTVFATSVRPPSPLKLHRRTKSPGSYIPIISPTRSLRSPMRKNANSPTKKSPSKLASLRYANAHALQDAEVSDKVPFVPSLIRDIKRAFPPLEPEENPRRKRFKVELQKAWTRNLELGLADY
ncbi:hypothetical protein HDU79_000320 [Rhizoclosmatium sp. JEL0117]|nr:hypothetical protein HDU79_000320 [Rhizoclosmatium sp. JEL0117]